MNSSPLKMLGVLAAAGSLATAASAQSVFATDTRNNRFVTFDIATPTQQTVLGTNLPSDYYALDFNADGSALYGVTDAAQLDTLNPADGSALTSTSLIGLDEGHTVTGLSIQATTGTAYLTSNGFDGSTLYTLDLGTANLTRIGLITDAETVIDIAASADGRLFATTVTDDVLLSVDPTTGVGTTVGPLGFDINFAQGMDFDDSTGTLYAMLYLGGGDARFASIDLATGAATVLATPPTGEYEIAVRPAPVPEPASLAALGLGATALIRRRRARRSAD